MRPFLLLQCRNPDDAMRLHEIACFERALGVGPEGIVVVNAPERMPTSPELAQCCAVLIGGSGDYSSLDELPWIDALIEFARFELITCGKPTFASCFGFQILVRAIGGEMIRDPANTEFGTYDMQLRQEADSDPVFGAMPLTFAAQVGHHDRALSLPMNVHCFASTPACPTHAFRIGPLPIWATQFHPELTMEDLELRYRHYAHYGANDDDADQPLLRPSQHATELLANFRAWVEAAERSAQPTARGESHTSIG